MLQKGDLKLSILALILVLFSSTANAILVTLDPDDYGLGVPLINPYVTTAYLDGSLEGDPWSSPLTAQDRREHGPDYQAPTGDLIFGAFPFIFPIPDYNYGFFGLGIKFNQDVFRVRLLANSLYTPGDLAAVWMAFDGDGNQLAFGTAGGDRPHYETFEIEIELRGIRSLILGGDAGTSAICFDYLTFEFDDLPDTSIPAPNPLALLLTGLAMIILRIKIRARQD